MLVGSRWLDGWPNTPEAIATATGFRGVQVVELSSDGLCRVESGELGESSKIDECPEAMTAKQETKGRAGAWFVVSSMRLCPACCGFSGGWVSVTESAVAVCLFRGLVKKRRLG